MLPFTPAAIIQEVNQTRKQFNLPPLAENPILTKAAQAKAEDMIKRSYFAHISPDGTHGYTLIGQNGYNYNTAGENLAEGFSNAKSVNDAWMNSPVHKANLLSPTFRDVGIAIVPGTYQGRKTNFIVQMFADPQTQKIVASKPIPVKTAVGKARPPAKGSAPAPSAPATPPKQVPQYMKKPEPNLNKSIKTYLGRK